MCAIICAIEEAATTPRLLARRLHLALFALLRLSSPHPPHVLCHSPPCTTSLACAPREPIAFVVQAIDVAFCCCVVAVVAVLAVVAIAVAVLLLLVVHLCA